MRSITNTNTNGDPEKKKIRDINKDLLQENEERIDEEINLINVQTDDTEDVLEEEEEDKKLEED